MNTSAANIWVKCTLGPHQTFMETKPQQGLQDCELDRQPELHHELPDPELERLPKTLQALPDSELDKPCTDLNLACIASDITEWERIAPQLGISFTEGEEIQHDSKSYRQEKFKVLLKWKNKHGSTATHRNLIQVLKQNEAIVQTKNELDRPCSDSDLALLANRLIEWEN